MMGPATDSIKIQAAVKNAGFLKSTLIHTVLYGRRGQSFHVTMHCAPYHDNCGQLVGCLIALAKSAAISIQQALEECYSPKALVSADHPNVVQMINPAFTNLFGFTESQATGRTLSTIYGPSTDVPALKSLFSTASTGLIAHGSVQLCSSSCYEALTAITVVPVMDGVSGTIANLLLYFTSSSQANNNCGSSFQGMMACDNTRSTEQGWQGFQRFDANNTPTSFAFPSSSASFLAPATMNADARRRAGQPPQSSVQRSCLTICPRRKTMGDAMDSDGNGPCPVSITLELLESMADLTIVAAAQRIRVSATSLKKACRKLGVDRWPYRKDRPSAATGGSPPAPPRDFDEAYVRKLHRKYGAAAPRRVGKVEAVVAPSVSAPAVAEGGDWSAWSEAVETPSSPFSGGAGSGSCSDSLAFADPWSCSESPASPDGGAAAGVDDILFAAWPSVPQPAAMPVGGDFGAGRRWTADDVFSFAFE